MSHHLAQMAEAIQWRRCQKMLQLDGLQGIGAVSPNGTATDTVQAIKPLKVSFIRGGDEVRHAEPPVWRGWTPDLNPHTWCYGTGSEVTKISPESTRLLSLR